MLFDSDFIRFFKALQIGVGKVAYQTVFKLNEIRFVAAVDAAYSRDKIAAAALVYDVKSDEIVEERRYVAGITFPYVPGLLFLREGPYMLKVVEELTREWDLLLVDAHGRAHPRRAGMATFLGLCVGKPTLGIAKRLLVGKITETNTCVSVIEEDGEKIGYAFTDNRGRKFYVSQGFGIEYEDIPRIIDMLGGYPRALTIVDKLSKKILRGDGSH